MMHKEKCKCLKSQAILIHMVYVKGTVHNFYCGKVTIYCGKVTKIVKTLPVAPMGLKLKKYGATIPQSVKP